MFECKSARRLRFVRWLSPFSLLAALFATSGNAAAGQLTLAWGQSAGAGGYKVYIGQSSRNYSSNIDAGIQTSYTVTGLNNGQTYYLAVTAYNADRTAESGFSNEVSAFIPSAPAPTASFTASATSGLAPLAVTFTDTSTGTVTSRTWNFGDNTSATTATVSKSYTDPGTYSVALTVTGNGGSSTATKTITVGAASLAPPPPDPNGGSATSVNGLVAAYGFDEAGGTLAADLSGNGNHGAISGANWINSGRGGYGSALAFGGDKSWVTINDSPSLDLTYGMTLEAWLYPTVWMSGWPTVLLKEDPQGDLAYAIYANNDWNQPNVQVGGFSQVTGVTQVAPNRWTHLAGTYDGQYLRLFVDGVLVSMEPRTGAIPVTGGPLRIGGNAKWGDYFTGYLDDIRIYNRPLSEAEIASDAKTPVGSLANLSVMWSSAGDRSGAAPLNGATVRQSIYVFTTPDADVSQVRFWLDNPTPASPTGAATTTENYAPFDFAGTAGNGMAYAYNTSQLSLGTHTISVRATMADGSVRSAVVATFTVAR